MAPEPLESDRVSLVGQHDLDGRPGFKIDFQEVDGRWYLYTACFWEPGFSVLDVTDPSDPELLNYVEGPENTLTIQVQVADGLMVTSLEKPRSGRGRVDAPEQDPTAPFEEGAYLWDVATDPTEPELLGQYRTGGDGTHRNFYNGGDLAYMAAVPGGEFEGRLLEIVDVADPSAPEPVSRWWWPGQGPGEDDPLPSYLMHGPAYPKDDLLYVSYGGVGMVVLDVADPAAPELIDRVAFGDFGSRIQTHSAIPIPGTDLVTVNSEALAEALPTEPDGEPLGFTVIVDASGVESGMGPPGPDEERSRIVSSVPLPSPGPDQPFETYYEKPGRFGPHNQHHHRGLPVRFETNDHLVMTYFNAGLRIFDISDPLQPTEVGHFVPGEPERRIARPRPGSGLVGTFEDVAIDARGNVFCSDPQQGLYVLESDLL